MNSMRRLALFLCFGALCSNVFCQDSGNLILNTNDLGVIQAITFEIRLAGDPDNDWVLHRVYGEDGVQTPMTYLWQNLPPASYEVRASVFLDDCIGEHSEIIIVEVLPLKPEPPVPTLTGSSDGVPPVDPVDDCNNRDDCTLITTF